MHKLYKINNKMKDKVKLINGIANRDGVPVLTAEDFLDASCKCGINCCYGYLKLPDYDSISGDATTAALYIVDGEIVISTVEEAEAAIRAFKNNVLISATGVTISGCELSSVVVVGGATRQLTKTVLPAGSLQTGVWSTSAAGVATVSVGGLVTGISAGTATITFTSTDGAFTATCIITVEEE